MSEDRPKYVTEAMEVIGQGYENAAEIHPPKTIRAIRDKGLEEYKVWGWVKISANFIHHINKLKGAKLAIWQVIALSIDETGTCNLTIQEIANLSGYSYSETHQSLKELDEMEYLSKTKTDGKKSMYSPNFAARGSSQPTDDPSRKTRGTDSAPLQSSGGHPSSPSIENALPSIKELKELIPLSIENAISVNQPVTTEMVMETKHRDEATKTFERALGFSKPLPWYQGKDWTAFAEWVCEQHKLAPFAFGEYNIWRNTPYTKGGMANTRIRGFVKEFYDSWDMFRMANPVRKTDEQQPTYTDANGVVISW